MTTTTLLALGHRAVILGGSMAGLLAARVLAERFTEVWLLERDELPAGVALRKGTPQAAHAHGLLARGREALESLFPGFTDSLAERGAWVGDMQANVVIMAGRRRHASGTAGMTGVAASRPLIEAELRRRVLALPGVRVLTSVDVIEPTLDAERRRVTGVRFARRGAAGSRSTAPETLAAELVVDATGRASHGPAWLTAWGYAAPTEERVTVGIGYATCCFERKPEHAGDIAAFIFAAAPELPRSGALLAQEPEEDGTPRWLLTLAGYAGDHPALSLAEVRSRAQQLGCPELIRVTHEARPLGPVLPFGFPHSSWRHYERLTRLPLGYLPIGDAIASFNPVYGQGMTVAACEALVLAEALRSGLDGLQPRFLRVAAKLVAVPWQIAVGTDLAIDSVPGARPLPVRLVNAYIGRLHRAAESDSEVALAFAKVLHMLEPPHTVMAPRILKRVLWNKPFGVPRPSVQRTA